MCNYLLKIIPLNAYKLCDNKLIIAYTEIKCKYSNKIMNNTIYPFIIKYYLLNAFITTFMYNKLFDNFRMYFAYNIYIIGLISFFIYKFIYLSLNLFIVLLILIPSNVDFDFFGLNVSYFGLKSIQS